MALFNDAARQQLTEMLKTLKEPVQILFFTQQFECNTCRNTHEFLEELTALSDKLSLVVKDFVKDSALAKQYGVDKIPAILILPQDQRDTGLKFYGVPGGYEINSFIKALQEVSGSPEKLPDDVLQRIRAIDKEVHIQVFITLACPYCPRAVVTAHRLALENPKVKADMVDAATFPHLANRYHVSSVPKIIINETREFVGAQPIETFLDTIEKL